jgi:type II restriction-modification system restriction subunit
MLRDLSVLESELIKQITDYKKLLQVDCPIPDEFKRLVLKIENNTITYLKYSFIVSTNLDIYFPNQLWYLAAICVPLYDELTRYRNFVEGLNDIKDCKGNEQKAEGLLENVNCEDLEKSLLVKFLSEYSWWKGGKTIDRGDYFYSPILAVCNLVNASQSYVAEMCKYLSSNPTATKILIDNLGNWEDLINTFVMNTSLQQIYYGAPGTGKSHIIKEQTEDKNVIRTTFHPDSDYSTFVGAYKPTISLLPICDELGQAMKIGDTILHKEQIVYEFVEQSFLQAYTQAWKFYAEASESDTPQHQFLIIEEINRGNCAQIFGDLFQLLDRNCYGFSDYPIQADKDMRKYLAKAFESLNIAQKNKINVYYKEREIVEKVLRGEILLLPNNLYIWATMNTSDQSLFPIDSAFKRRWDWQYMPIVKGYDNDGKELHWTIKVNGNSYNWWSFLEKINEQIEEITNAEDKKLGFFFCKATNNIIPADKFVSKVLFYLWNDVFKDYGFDGAIFKDNNGTDLVFNKFFQADNKGNGIVQEDKVMMFLDNLGVERDFTDNIEEEVYNDTTSGIRDKSLYSINGSGSYSKAQVAYQAMQIYIQKYPTKTGKEVVKEWLSLGVNLSNFVETQEMFEKRKEGAKDAQKRAYQVELANGDLIYVSNQYNPEKIADFINKINSTDWGIFITKNS